MSNSSRLSTTTSILSNASSNISSLDISLHSELKWKGRQTGKIPINFSESSPTHVNSNLLKQLGKKRPEDDYGDLQIMVDGEPIDFMDLDMPQAE